MFTLSPRPTALIAAIGLLALALRALAALGHSIVPATDEIGYLTDGLLLLEGLAPGYKHVPNAPIDWIVGVYAGAQTLVQWLTGGGDPSVPPLLRPLTAMDRALFALYADMSGPRAVVVAVQIAMGSLAAAALAWRGWRIAGLRGAFLAGALAAATPIFVEYASETRAYSLAWSLGLLAFAAVASDSARWRVTGTSVLIGLAIASRIEMALCLVPLLLEMLRRAAPGQRGIVLVKSVAIAVLTFLAAAPWYITSLAGNLRQIISVRILNVPVGDGSLVDVVRGLLESGIGVPIVLVLALLILAARGPGWLFHVATGLWLALMAAMALRPSNHGLRHDGALLVIAAVMAPVALALGLNLARRLAVQRVATIVTILLRVQVLAAGGLAAWTTYRAAVRGDPVAWIESHVPPGSRLYWTDGFAVPLPTTENADHLWSEVAAPDAWRKKFEAAAQRFHLGADLPRAMSEDPMQLERAQRRRWFILGGQIDKTRPRYDLRLRAETDFALPLTEIVKRMCAEGGAFVHQGAPLDQLGTAKATWLPLSGDPLGAVRIYQLDPPRPGEKRC